MRTNLIIPPGSSIGDGKAVFKGDVVFSDYSSTSLDIETQGRLFAGESVDFSGSLEVFQDVSLDRSTRVAGDLTSGGSVHLSERVHVAGKLTASQDLDVASEVDIDGGFEVKGWINVRTPISLMVYIVIYIMELLKQGRSEDVEKVLDELEEMCEIKVNEGYAFIPKDGSIQDIVATKGGCRIGDASQVPGIDAGDWVRIGEKAEIFGSVMSGEDVTLSEGVLVHGNVSAKGRVVLGPSVHVTGSVNADSLNMARDSVVEGDIVAPKGLRFTIPSRVDIEERLGKYEVGMEQVAEMLQ